MIWSSDDLVLRFNRTGACDHAEVSAADLDTVHIDHGVLGMEFPVRPLEGIGYLLNGIDDLETLEQCGVNGA